VRRWRIAGDITIARPIDVVFDLVRGVVRSTWSSK